ncbi:hypothetical protein N9164_00455 [Draconibacterium sp.]|nr:hypothetical protein [Draconibacterium sp.]
MQTIINNNELDKSQYPVKIFFGDYEISKEIRIVDFMKKTEAGESIITLCSRQFLDNPVKVTIRDKKLIIIISEFVDARKNIWKPVNDWEQYMMQSYTRMHNVSLLLPGDNFYILRHFLIPDKLFLRVVLGQSTGD